MFSEVTQNGRFLDLSLGQPFWKGFEITGNPCGNFFRDASGYWHTSKKLLLVIGGSLRNSYRGYWQLFLKEQLLFTLRTLTKGY
jgi:hypothetical protein